MINVVRNKFINSTVNDFGNINSYRHLVAITMDTVEQVINEAHVILNIAKDSGDSQHVPIENSKILRTHVNKINIIKHENLVAIEENVDNHSMKHMATSTPQKTASVITKSINQQTELHGQGDGNIVRDESILKNEDTTFPSMLITIDNLIDTSEDSNDNIEQVKRNEEDDDNSTIPSMLITIDNLTDTTDDSNKTIEQNKNVPNLMDFPVNEILNIAFKEDLQTESLPISEKGVHTTYTIVTEALINETDNTNLEQQSNEVYVEVKNLPSYYFENPFLTLNRDEEQNSEKAANRTLSQESVRSFHDIQLISSKENLDSTKEKAKEKKLTSTKICRIALTKRCRQRGARLMACLRRWWKRGSPNKQQSNAETRFNSSFPLSPTPKYRISTLDNRRRVSPKFPKKYFMRKFDTLNSVFNNSRFKELNSDIVKF